MTDTGLAIDFNDSVVLGHVDPHQVAESQRVRELKEELAEANSSIDNMNEKIQELELKNTELERDVAYFYGRSSKYEIRLKVQNGAWNSDIALRWDTKMSKLFQGYKIERNISPETDVNFIWRGYKLLPDDTANSLKMHYDDLVTAEH